MIENLLYIHGFNSSPLSEKARCCQQYFAQYFPSVTFHCPQLKNEPMAAIDQLQSIIATQPNQAWGIIGSSLGGFFATYLSETYQCKTVLINPAVTPYILLHDYLGEQQNPYTGERFFVETQFIEHLKSLEQKTLNYPENYLVLVQTGDEVLNYQQAVEKYAKTHLVIEQGGNHSFEHFDERLPTIASFLMTS
jgi:hypothetical protein